MKKILIIAALILVGGVIFITQISNFPVNRSSGQPSSTPAPKQQTVEETIIYGDSKPDELLTAQINPGESAFDLLNRTKKIEFKQYSFGKSVESIEGVKSGADNKYWMLYVNGNLSQVGSEQYQLKADDKIEWRLEKGQ